MGGRGTYAAGNNPPYTYETVGMIEGVKVLSGLGDKHDLPVEAHLSEAYIQLYPDGNFKMLRFFDKEHYLTLEIGYHPEKDLDKSRKPLLHVHEYPVHDDFSKRTTKLMTEEEYRKYKKYFGGITRWKPET